jgi:uncharacterized membrane protein YgdD (TMEM256/DUF423 family)
MVGDVTETYFGTMPTNHDKARADFLRMARWIVAIGVLMATGAILYLGLTGELYLHMVVATVGGVFLSVVLGCGLMAASFFSDKSGHDQAVTDATSRKG